jgi:phage FluMu protein Com
MPINIICPGCHKRFTVAEKFAGKKGPCPNCKTVIEIPKLEDQVVIHAPEHSEAGAIGASGRHALKTYKRKDTKFKPLMFAAVSGVVLVTLLIALLLRGVKLDPATSYAILTLGAVVLGPPLAWAGYTFLRDDELEGYQGVNLAVRAVACGLVYALLWGVYVFVGDHLFGSDALAKGLQIYEMGILVGLALGIGTLTAYVAFDLDPGSGFFHVAMYFAVTVLLRLVVGLAAVPGLVTG